MRTYEDYKIKGDTFKAKFDNRCCIDKRHKIHRRDVIAFVELKDNPHITIEGPACASCVAVMD